MVGPTKKETAPIVSLLSGGIAGMVEAAATYPFEFAKTRVQLGNQGKTSPRNPFLVVHKVYTEEGLAALYKGCSSLVVVSKCIHIFEVHNKFWCS